MIQEEEEVVKFCVGLCADTQYVDEDDGSTFDGKIIRRYRQSLRTFREAVELYHRLNLQYCILLGDICDGKCRANNSQHICLAKVQDVAQSVDCNQTWIYTYGNHDFYNFTRNELYDLIPSFIRRDNGEKLNPSKLYYSWSPVNGIKFIILDPYDISTIGASSSYYAEYANQLLANKNKNIAIPKSDWFDGIAVENWKYVPYNGAISQEQINWLKMELLKANINKEVCFIFSHISVYSKCCQPAGLIWNNNEVLELLHGFDNIAAFISGHDHQGGYAKDEYDIHHIVLPAPLECGLNEVAFGYLSILDSYFELFWIGKQPYTWNGGRPNLVDERFPLRCKLPSMRQRIQSFENI